MIVRFSAEDLRRIADQLDAYTALEHAGASHQPANTRICVKNGDREDYVAYLYWWQDREKYLAEFICFTPTGAQPLYYNELPSGRWHRPEDQEGKAL